MFLNDFFRIIKSENFPQKIETTVAIKSDHIIFEGHFPSDPITPGVLQIQMVKEILEDNFALKLDLQTIGRCKFLAVLNPKENNNITIIINYKKQDGLLSVKAMGKDDNNTYFKFNAVYSNDLIYSPDKLLS